MCGSSIGGEIFTQIPSFKQTFLDEDCEISMSEYENLWIDLGKIYPQFNLLAKAVQTLLSLPSTEAECERIFSLMKRIVTDKRKSLSPENIEACCIVSALHGFRTGRGLDLSLPPRETDVLVSRETCQAVVTYCECVRHNKAVGAASPYKVNSEKALLWPNDDQEHLKNGAVCISINRAGNELETLKRNNVPLTVVQYRAAVTKKDKKKKTAEDEQDAVCAGCNKLFVDHQDAVDGVDESAECADCEKWFHYECSGLRKQVWVDLVLELQKQDQEVRAGKRARVDREYVCPNCSRERRRKQRDEAKLQARRRRQRQETDDDAEEDGESSDDEVKIVDDNDDVLMI